MALEEKKNYQRELLDNPNIKLAYKVFLKDVDAHFDDKKQQIDMITTDREESNLQKTYNNLKKEKYDTIANHVKMAKIFQETGQPEKSIIPFAVFSSIYGQEENPEKNMTDKENYQVSYTIWGAYNIVDNIQSKIAKNSMFQLAIVPLNSSDKETKTIQLSQAMEHFQQENDKDGIQAVLESAVVPLIHNNGKQVVSSLKDIFTKIDAEPEYRKKILSDIPNKLSISLENLTFEIIIPKIIGAGKIVTTSEENQISGLNEQRIEEETIGHYVNVLNTMEASEDMQACAEYLMTNAIVTLENDMQALSSYGLINKDADYYITTSKLDNANKLVIDELVTIEVAKPAIEKAMNTFYALSSIFISTSEDKTAKKLNPLFKNVDKKLKESFETALDNADNLLGILSVPLENRAKKEQLQTAKLKQAKKYSGPS